MDVYIVYKSLRRLMMSVRRSFVGRVVRIPVPSGSLGRPRALTEDNVS